MYQEYLQTSLTRASRIYKMYSSRLEKLGIFTLNDFLWHLPFRYDDFSLISKIAQIQAGEAVTIHGQVISIKNIFTKYGKKIQKAIISDDTGSIEVVWYNQTFLTKYIHVNDQISLSGKADLFNNKVVLTSPDFEIISENQPINPNESLHLHTGRLVPIYPETKGVSSKWLRKQIHSLLKELKDEIQDFMPDAIISKYSYPKLNDALSQIHFPESLEKAERARERLAFDELFLLQLKSKRRRVDWDKNLKGYPLSVDKYQKEINKFIESIPFTLTTSQTKAIHEILRDMMKEKPMNRLLQGDVGSGKTIVGIYAIYIAYLNGFQSVLMAPTEILAEQHYLTIKKFLEPFGVKIALATSSKKEGFKKQDSRSKNAVHNRHPELVSGSQNNINKMLKQVQHDNYFDVLIGTHAVLNEKIKFNKLGLVIIDEQQRFGVEQRSSIRGKGVDPHFLTMTATPIPRTVALTMYGDLDISYLNELPSGRKRIKTWLIPQEKRDASYDWIKKQIKELRSQVFIICPFIEESENMQTIKAAKVEFERLKMEIFPDLRLEMLHGKLKGKEKDQILSDFREKKFDILVATPVVEVGIDIPNATVILIEAAERFGLSQLHQLRGRVGRSDKQSYCLLFSETKAVQSITRLKALEIKHIGSELAELDLKLRGPGDIFGTTQSGLPKLKAASFSDFSLIKKARYEAEQIFSNLSIYPLLEEKLSDLTNAKVSPD